MGKLTTVDKAKIAIMKQYMEHRYWGSHSISHAFLVSQQAVRKAREEGVTGKGLELTEIAGLLHDMIRNPYWPSGRGYARKTAKLVDKTLDFMPREERAMVSEMITGKHAFSKYIDYADTKQVNVIPRSLLMARAENPFSARLNPKLIASMVESQYKRKLKELPPYMRRELLVKNPPFMLRRRFLEVDRSILPNGEEQVANLARRMQDIDASVLWKDREILATEFEEFRKAKAKEDLYPFIDRISRYKDEEKGFMKNPKKLALRVGGRIRRAARSANKSRRK